MYTKKEEETFFITFTNVFIFVTLFTFLTFFYFYLNVFYIYAIEDDEKPVGECFRSSKHARTNGLVENKASGDPQMGGGA